LAATRVEENPKFARSMENNIHHNDEISSQEKL